MSPKCDMGKRVPLSGSLTSAYEKEILKLFLGDYCLFANLFLDELDHGCPLITGYDYRTKQKPNIHWERFYELVYGIYDLLGIRFSPSFYDRLGFAPKYLHNNKKSKKSGRRR